MNKTKISNILVRLMAEKKIRVAELARHVKLPQPTIHRIATGVCEHPHLSSLIPIADYFSITVAQLKGHDPIPWLDNVYKIPLISWEEAINWTKIKKNKQYNELVFTDVNAGKNGYALKIKDASMDPVFPQDTILIVNPDKEIKDRSFVIVALSNLTEAIFRQLIKDANNNYLKPLSPEFDKYTMTRLTTADKILSVVVQARRDC